MYYIDIDQAIKDLDIMKEYKFSEDMQVVVIAAMSAFRALQYLSKEKGKPIEEMEIKDLLDLIKKKA